MPPFTRLLHRFCRFCVPFAFKIHLQFFFLPLLLIQTKLGRSSHFFVVGVGRLVGTGVGDSVGGWVVGVEVGATVGLSVGRRVGLRVGENVGKGVGSGVAIEYKARKDKIIHVVEIHSRSILGEQQIRVLKQIQEKL